MDFLRPGTEEGTQAVRWVCHAKVMPPGLRASQLKPQSRRSLSCSKVGTASALLSTGRGPRVCCAPQLKHSCFHQNLLLVSEMQLLC